MKVRPTFTDIVILLLVGLALLSFASKYAPQLRTPDYEFQFSGSQIYSAAAFFENLESKGFLYTVRVKGFYASDYAPFEEEGLVVSMGRGNFTLKTPGGETYSVGGRGSYLEDVQAERMVVRQLSKSTIIFSLADFSAEHGDELASKIMDAASLFSGTYPNEDVAFSARLSIDAQLSPSVAEEARLESLIKRNVYRLKGVSVDMKEDGFVVTVEKMSLSGVGYLFELLSQYGTGKVFVSEATVYCQTSGEIDPKDIDALEALAHPAIVAGSIHVRV